MRSGSRVKKSGRKSKIGTRNPDIVSLRTTLTLYGGSCSRDMLAYNELGDREDVYPFAMPQGNVHTEFQRHPHCVDQFSDFRMDF